MIKKILVAGAACIALSGCIQVDRPEPASPEPVPSTLHTIAPTNTSHPVQVEVTIYKDPGGCQYLVFNDLGRYGTISVVPRMHDESNAVCISSRTPDDR
jgi:predicted component of type VI protein secretion system